MTTTAARLDPGTEWTSGESSGVTLTAADGTITILTTEKYATHFWCSFNTDSVAAGTLYTFYYAINGVPSVRSIPVQKLTAGVDRLNVAAMGIIPFTTGDVLSIYVKSSVNSTIIPVDAGLFVHKV